MRELKGIGNMRGIIQGSLWGLVLGGLGLGALSLIAPLPAHKVGLVVPLVDAPRLDPVGTQTTEPVLVAPVQTHTRPALPLQTFQPAPQDRLAAVQTDPAVPPKATDVTTNLSAPDRISQAEPVVRPETPPVSSDLSALEPAQDAEAQIAVQTRPLSSTTIAPVIVEEAPMADSAIAAPPAPVVLPAAPQVSEQIVRPRSGSVTVRVNRPGAIPADSATQQAETPEADALPDDAPALQRYAAAFENPDALPVIGIILVDDGAMVDAAGALASLGFTPTIALNALRPDISDKMAAYRRAGLEIAAQADLPVGAQPTDVEVAFEAAFGLLPEAAMLFSDGTGILQSDRFVAGQVMQILAADGRGFVTVQQGLGNAARIAEQAGVVVATILRDMDGASESPAQIARALDQAAFRARQSGGAILMGRVTPATLDALRDWARDIDASQLLIAPVSAVLLDQPE